MSRRLDLKLATLAERNEGVFMPYLVAGDPSLELSRTLAHALIDAGADVLELGLPFSDPTADGPLLQAASKRSLAAGTRTEHAFELFAAIRRSSEVPIALLLYYNLVLQHGVDQFFTRASASGVDAVLIADLPLEEIDPVLHAAEATDIAPIFIVSARTSDARLDKISRYARGYLYLVARLGVTGVRDGVEDELEATIARIRARTRLPVLAGFGLSRPEHVERVLSSGAHGAIVGSAIARVIEENLGHDGAMMEAVGQLARSMKDATRRRASGEKGGM